MPDQILTGYPNPCGIYLEEGDGSSETPQASIFFAQPVLTLKVFFALDPPSKIFLNRRKKIPSGGQGKRDDFVPFRGTKSSRLPCPLEGVFFPWQRRKTWAHFPPWCTPPPQWNLPLVVRSKGGCQQGAWPSIPPRTANGPFDPPQFLIGVGIFSLSKMIPEGLKNTRPATEVLVWGGGPFTGASTIRFQSISLETSWNLSCFPLWHLS